MSARVGNFGADNLPDSISLQNSAEGTYIAALTLTGEDDEREVDSTWVPVGVVAANGKLLGALNPVSLSANTVLAYAASGYNLVFFDTGAGEVLTIPGAAVAGAGASIWVKNLSGTEALTITPAAGQIEGGATLSLAANQGVQIASNGTAWYVIAHYDGSLADLLV